MYRRSFSGSAVNGESRRDAVSPLAHAANAKAGRFTGDQKAAAVVFDNQFERSFQLDERKIKASRMSVQNCICNGFLADAKQRIGDS